MRTNTTTSTSSIPHSGVNNLPPTPPINYKEKAADRQMNFQIQRPGQKPVLIFLNGKETIDEVIQIARDQWQMDSSRKLVVLAQGRPRVADEGEFHHLDAKNLRPLLTAHISEVEKSERLAVLDYPY